MTNNLISIQGEKSLFPVLMLFCVWKDSGWKISWAYELCGVIVRSSSVHSLNTLEEMSLDWSLLLHDQNKCCFSSYLLKLNPHNSSGLRSILCYSVAKSIKVSGGNSDVNSRGCLPLFSFQLQASSHWDSINRPTCREMWVVTSSASKLQSQMLEWNSRAS